MIRARRSLRNQTQVLPICCMHCEEMVPDRVYLGS